jgi:hypothetical protein
MLLIIGCEDHTYYEDLIKDDHERLYRWAIEDAEISEPDEIYSGLTAITAENDDLIWQDDQNGGKLLVVTWTDWDGYEMNIGSQMTLERDVWVTVAPEIQEFFLDNLYEDGDITRRAEQLLGLPPDSGYLWFVEIWVDPEEIFRPSPDPEINDREAVLDFSEGNRFIAVSEDYISWFTARRESMYAIDGTGYPWTRLGYTYDWGNERSEVGLSEFVIIEDSVVEIKSVTPTLEYLK